MSLLNDVSSRINNNGIELQQQPKFPLEYSMVYGPYEPITSLEETYRRNFINLLLTNPGEWPMSPELGIGIRKYIFELENSVEFTKLKPRIEEQLRRFLPRVELHDLIIDKSEELVSKNKARIVINYVVFRSISITTILEASLIGRTLKIFDASRTQRQQTDLLNRAASWINEIAEF